jgi:hypothetical protein
VTGLAEFLAVGRLFSLGSSFENYESSPHFWATFSLSLSYASILTKKWFGLHFGRFFHQLIWSPCSRERFVARLCLLMSSQLSGPDPTIVSYNAAAVCKNLQRHEYGTTAIPRTTFPQTMFPQTTFLRTTFLRTTFLRTMFLQTMFPRMRFLGLA